MIVERFPFPSPLLRFPTKSFRPGIDASAASSHPVSRPPLSLPQLFSSGRRLVCSLGTFNLFRLLPPLTLPPSHLHLAAPFSLLDLTHLTMN
jgi:hypothetical protein